MRDDQHAALAARSDCELLAHPNVTGEGCPCGKVVILRPPAINPAPLPLELWPQPLPPVLSVIRGDAPRERPKAQLRTHRTSLRRPKVWA